MKLTLSLIDQVQVELTEEGQKVLIEHMLKQGYIPNTGSVRRQEFFISELLMVFGPHMTINNYGIPTKQLFVGNQVHLPLRRE